MKMSKLSLAPPEHPRFILPGKLRKSPTQSTESGAKASPAELSWKDRTGYPHDINSRQGLIDREIPRSISPHCPVGAFRVLGPFERLRFKKNPYCGSFGTSLTKSWLTLDYRKDPGFKTGEAFPLWRTN